MKENFNTEQSTYSALKCTIKWKKKKQIEVEPINNSQEPKY